MDYTRAIETILRLVPDALAVYLFGSRAAGEERPDSDVDLALLAPRSLDSVERWQLQEDVASILRASVDLVDLRGASTVLRAQVVTGGELLHDADPAGRALFETNVLSDYARLNEERAEILADIRQRGTVHG